jgi:hypothetical protein
LDSARNQEDFSPALGFAAEIYGKSVTITSQIIDRGIFPSPVSHLSATFRYLGTAGQSTRRRAKTGTVCTEVRIWHAPAGHDLTGAAAAERTVGDW